MIVRMSLIIEVLYAKGGIAFGTKLIRLNSGLCH